MGMLDGITLGIALLSLGLGVFNTVTGFRRASVRWRISGSVKQGKDGQLALYVELVNTGRIAVKVEEVFLTGPGKQQAARSEGLRNSAGHPTFPRKLPEGEKIAIGPVHTWTLQQVLMFKPLWIVAQTEDGRVIKRRCTGLRQLYDQLEATLAKDVAQLGAKTN